MAKNSSKIRAKRWTDISGEMMVFENEVKTHKSSFVKYSTSIGVKNNEGEWDNMYMDVRFKKDEEPDAKGGVKININSGYLSFNKGKDGRCYPCIVVLDYHEV